MQEAHAVDATLGQEMLHLLLEGELVHHFVLDDRLVKLLVG